MATKKKVKKKQAKAKKTAGKSAKKLTAKKKLTARKKPAKKKAIKAKAVARKTASRKTVSAPKKKPQGTQSSAIAYPPESRSARTGGQSGSLQGLSDVESADSESVDELLEEGNAFEADVVSGVEAADREEGHEVHTHEVPEDDVPEEYFDKD